MSPQIRADAARISPFPQTLVAQQGSSGAPLIESNDSARFSHAKAKKARGRPRQERNLRSDEDIRFNVGPLRKMIVGSGRRPPLRMGRQDRPYHDGINDDVPNYPPPSFQEAMSTASLSVCPSTTTLLNDAAPVPPNLTEVAAERERNNVPVVSQPHVPDPLVDCHSESDSDESIEIIDKNTIPVSSADLPSGPKLEASIKKDWRHRRGVEFPAASPLQVDDLLGGSRGRARNRSRELLPSELEDIEVPLHSPTTPKRRYMSLSPLRTFFPSRSLALQDKSLSAHPSPGSSPYSPSRSKTFFRSTTSIATNSIFRLPLIATSAPTTRRSDNSAPRKLFSSKGKEKARDSSDSDNLDVWELVDNKDQVVRSMDITVDPATPKSLGASPTRSQSFTFGSPASEAAFLSPIHTSDYLPQETPYGPHPLSLRDQKVAEIYSRPARRGPKGHEPPRRVPDEGANTPITLGPIVTTVRTRKIEIPLSQRRTPSPLCAVQWEGDEEDEGKAAALFQQALNTPLPLSPINFSPDYLPASPTTPTGNYSLSTSSSPTTPVPERSQMSSYRGVLNDLPNSAQFSCDNVELGSLLYQPTLLSQNASRPTLQEPLTPTRRYHYPGRPLPRPPGSIRSDPTSMGATEQPNPSDAQCPEGLLIDLDDTSLTNSSSGTSTPHTEDDRFRSNSSIALVTSLLDSPIVDTSSRSTPSTNGLSDMTDLDLLVSQLSDEQHGGSNYEALLLVSEFLGPANAPSQSYPLQSAPATNENVNISLIGRIDLVRRRMTNDGRVKLRLSLLGIAVDRCGICLSQFRPEEVAGLTSTCHHAFHEKCLVKWLARNKTCPLCRIPLDVDI